MAEQPGKPLMKTLTLKPSRQIRSLLTQIASYGIHGTTEEEVAERFISERLIELLRNQPNSDFFKLKIPRPRARRRKRK